MAGRRKVRSDDPVPSKALVASAKRFTGVGDPGRMARRGGSGWQDAAWHFYNTIGEYAYAVNWVGNLLSRAKLYATRDDGTGPKKLGPEDAASQYLDALFLDAQGKATALQQIGVHYTVTGEAYIVGTTGDDGDHWEIVASSRISGERRSDDSIQWTVDGVVLDDDPLVIRIWRPHPVEKGAATSPSRAALPILSEIERLTMHVAAQVDSRLISAGILFLPNEMTFAVIDEDGNVLTGSSDLFVQTLQDVAARAIQNRDSAGALVPIVVSADGESIDKAKHLTFWSELDNQAIELRTEAIRRLALSMDMPPEILTGQGDTNHWSAWSIDESAIKSHTEPLLARIADDLAVGYLRTMLVQDGMSPEESRAYGIGVDTTEMRLRPNRSQEALELWDRGVLNSSTLVEETGFKVDNIQDDAEHQRWLIDKVATGQTTPEAVIEALKELGVVLNVQEDPDPPEDRPGQHEARPTPSLNEHPSQDPPDSGDALAAACEVLVFRALERAGNRLKNKTQRRIPGVAAADTYMFHKVDTGTLDFVLEDAWSAVDRFAKKHGADAQELAGYLDAYTRAIMVEQKPHDEAMMRSFINLAKVNR